MLIEAHDIFIAYAAMGLAHAASAIFGLDEDYEATVRPQFRKRFPLWAFQLIFAIIIFLFWPFLLSTSITVKMAEVEKK